MKMSDNITPLLGLDKIHKHHNNSKGVQPLHTKNCVLTMASAICITMNLTNSNFAKHFQTCAVSNSLVDKYSLDIHLKPNNNDFLKCAKGNPGLKCVQLKRKINLASFRWPTLWFLILMLKYTSHVPY